MRTVIRKAECFATPHVDAVTKASNCGTAATKRRSDSSFPMLNIADNPFPQKENVEVTVFLVPARTSVLCTGQTTTNCSVYVLWFLCCTVVSQVRTAHGVLQDRIFVLLSVLRNVQYRSTGIDRKARRSEITTATMAGSNNISRSARRIFVIGLFLTSQIHAFSSVGMYVRLRAVYCSIPSGLHSSSSCELTSCPFHPMLHVIFNSLQLQAHWSSACHTITAVDEY